MRTNSERHERSIRRRSDDRMRRTHPVLEALEERIALAFTVNHTPYIQLGNARLDGFNAGFDQAEIIWQTTGTQGTDSFTAEFRETGASTWVNTALNATIDTGVGGRINHSVAFTGLNFDDDYDYRITHLRGGSAIATYQSTFHTRLDVDDSAPFTFATYGDSASGDPPTNFIAVQNQINTLNPAFSVLLGDNVYTSGTHSEYDLRLDPSKNPALTTYNKSRIDYFGFGNHDVGYNSGQAARENYSMPIPVEGVTSAAGLSFDANVQAEENYSFDYGSAHFVTFDTNNWSDVTVLDKQLDWAVADIQAARARPNPAKWVIVFGHHPIISRAGHTEHTADDFYYDQVVARLGSGPGGVGADLFLAGHTHNYQRSYPLTGHSGSTATFVLDTDSNYAKGAGLPLVIQGTGGVDLGYGANDATFAGTYLAKALDTNTTTPVQYGFGRVDVTSTQLTYRYVNTLGQTLDTFTITDGGDTTGPRATMSSPQDNGVVDFNGTQGQLALSGPQPHFQLRLWDMGGGVDDATVLSSAVSITRNGAALVAGTHYSFQYNPANNIVTLTPIGTTFGSGTYVISLASSIEDLANNSLSPTAINIVVNSSTSATVTFRNGENGYSGAKDTYVHQDDPATNQGSNVKVVADGDDDLGTAETPVQIVQGLIRFDGTFNTPSGSRGGGPIPDGSTITSATLTVRTGSVSGDEAPAGNYFTLHRMIATWGESSTWDSLVNGVSLDDLEAVMAATTFVNGPATLGGTVSFDVTADVQTWSNNNSLSTRGWVIHPLLGTNGWRLDSSNTGTIANRPILTVTYQNGPANVMAGGPYSTPEGSSLILAGSASGSGLTYTWDLNGDTVFGDAVGATPTVSWAQLVSLGIADGPSTRAITMRVTDSASITAQDTTWLTITNAAPVASMSSPSSAVVRGEPTLFTLSAIDPSSVDQAALFTFNIDWNGDFTTDQVVVGPSGSVISHVFTGSGPVTVRLTAQDKDGGLSTSFSQPVSVVDWALKPNGGSTDLVWGGTTLADSILFRGFAGNIEVYDLTAGIIGSPIAGVTGKVVAYLQSGDDLAVTQGLAGAAIDGGDGHDAIAPLDASGGAYSLTGGIGDDKLYFLQGQNVSIVMDGGEGIDELYLLDGSNVGLTMQGGAGADALVIVDGSAISAQLDGGADDDAILNLTAFSSTVTMLGGSGHDLLIGGIGADSLEGGAGDDLILGGLQPGSDASDTISGGDGRDVLAGHIGADLIIGGIGEDLILAGSFSTSYFGDEPTPGIVQVWDQWRTTDPLATRVGYLTGTSGGIIDPLYTMIPGSTVLDDGAVDTIAGDGDGDWMIYDWVADLALDFTLGVDLRTDL